MSGCCSSSAARYFSTDEVLADVVDVALDRADDHLADLGGAGLGEERAEDRHARLHGIGGKEHFRHEKDAVAEIDADDAHALDQRLGQHIIGRPAALQEDVHGCLDLGGEPVIEIVMHLPDELFVVERIQVEVVTVSHRMPFTHAV
jgi:hypothetical protein